MTGSLGPGRVSRRGPMRDHRPVTTPSPELSPELTELAHAYGIATHYVDWRGRPVDVPAETVHDVLAAMDVDATDPAAALARRQEEPWRRLLPPSVVVHQQETRTFAVHMPHGDPVEVVVDLADGGS